jgi:hypothetical protein
MEGIIHHPTAVLVPLLVALAVDVISGLTWWPDYFRIGLPLFVRGQPYTVAVPALPGSKALADRFSGSWVLPLVFRRLSPTEIAVRESFWGGFFRVTYSPLVHGILEINEVSREIRIVGRVNFLPLALVAVLAAPIVTQTGPANLFSIVLLVLLVAGPLLAVQYVRYGRVVKEALRLMEVAHESRA